jgi:hypothetical protein
MPLGAQFLVNFLLGEESGVTAPVIEMTRAEATIRVAAGETREARRTSDEPVLVAAGG